MSRCPRCRCTFRTLEDEVGMHACPRCGLEPDAVWPPRHDDDADDELPEPPDVSNCDAKAGVPFS